MKLERAGHGAFALKVSATELSTLIAAVRVAADVLEADERTPPAATATLRSLLRDYERAAARLETAGGPGAGPPADSPDSGPS